MDMLNTLLEKKKVAQDKDIKDRDGTQPKKYFAKDADGDEMAKSTKDARARHFEKGRKAADDDDSAYEPAPGDKSAETKPSQHTKKYKKMFGEVEEGKLVSSIAEIIDAIFKTLKRKLESEYKKNPEKGLGMINTVGSFIGYKVTDKKQEKNKLFLKFGDNIQEDAAVDAAQLKAKHAEQMERLKANHEQELEALKDRHERETSRIDQQKEKETQDKQIQSKRDADRKSAEKKKESQQEERDYKKEYADYHSKPEQVKRRTKRNEARRSLKDRKDIKGKDVHHKDNNPMNNDKSNLSIVSQKYNRSEPRLRKLKEKGLLPNGRK